ncbi:MAG: hypothetical protein IJ960_00945 [Oscillospiraceae bacterium]|nr:hypothetical protein [Oscillospiraceae bacterium]
MKYFIIYALNLLDAIITLYWVGIHGIGVEINPLMRMALSNPIVFVAVKLVLFPILLIWMWYKHHDDTAWFALGAFSAVAVLNISTVFG